MNVNIFLAFAAGLISFLSPCIFPVIPSYLSYIGGLSISNSGFRKNERWDLLLNSILFVAGFTVVFILMGIFFSSIGVALSGITSYINMAAGIVVIVLGLNFIFNFWKVLNMEKRFHFKRKPAGKPGSVLIGMAFGAGWTPCIGPILASILFIAGSSGSIYRGAVLLFAFSAGLGIPFISAGLFFSFFKESMSKVNPYLTKIKIGSGIFLIAVGVLIFSGQLTRMNIVLNVFAERIRIWELHNNLEARLVYGTLFLIATGITLFLKRGRLKTFIRNRRNSNVPFLLLAFLVAEIILSVLVYTGIFDVGELIQKWITFKGI